MCGERMGLELDGGKKEGNEAAGSAATEGVYMAASMASRGETEPRICITKYDGENG